MTDLLVERRAGSPASRRAAAGRCCSAPGGACCSPAAASSTTSAMRRQYQRDRHGVDGRRAGQHRRRHRGRPAARRRARPDGRGVVGAVDPAHRRAVLLPRRTQPARLPAGRTPPAGASSTRRRPYVDAVHAMLGTRRAPTCRPGWSPTRRYRDRYLFAGRGPRAPLPRRWFAAGVAHRADTLDELAGRIGVPADALRATVDRFNGFAARGHDDDFRPRRLGLRPLLRRPAQRSPTRAWARVRKPPFYAFQMVPGDLGTKGGLRTDERARVLRADGTADPRAVRGGQRQRRGDGPQLRRRRRDARPRHDLRLPGRARPGRAPPDPGRAPTGSAAALHPPGRTDAHRPRGRRRRRLPGRELSWDSTDVLLYHLAVGAGPDELPLRLRGAPCAACCPPSPRSPPRCATPSRPRCRMPGIDVDLARVVHGRQELVLHQPAPAARPGAAPRADRRRLRQGQRRGRRHRDHHRAVHQPDQHLRQGRGRLRRRPRPVHPGAGARPRAGRSRCSPAPTRGRRCGTGCAATATRCTSTRRSPPRPASPARSCTASARTGSWRRRRSTPRSTATRPGWPATAARFAGVVFPGETLRTRIWREDGRLVLAATVADRDDAPALSDAVLTVR